MTTKRLRRPIEMVSNALGMALALAFYLGPIPSPTSAALRGTSNAAAMRVLRLSVTRGGEDEPAPGSRGFGLFLAVYPLFRIGRAIAGHWIALAPARFVVWNWPGP